MMEEKWAEDVYIICCQLENFDQCVKYGTEFVQC